MKTIPELQTVCNKVGEFIQYWGFRKIEGMIWARIFLSKKSICAQDLVEFFSVSKALISMSIAELQNYNLIIVDSETKEGKKIFFKTNPNYAEVIAKILRSREKVMISEIKSANEMLMNLKSDRTTRNYVSFKNSKQLNKLIGSGNKMLDQLIVMLPLLIGK